MTFEELAVMTAVRLDDTGIPYMLTGALAVSFYGEPRMTHDVDIVVLIAAGDVQPLVQLFGQDFFMQEESIKAALREVSMFNVIHKETGLKVDFWMRKNDDYSRGALERRARVAYGPRRICLASAEDTIITKLEWYKLSDIDKHFSDAHGVYRVQKETLDVEYITRWCEQKSLVELWKRVQGER